MGARPIFDKLDLSPAFRPVGKPAWVGERPIHGWDTETANGTPFVLSWAFQGRDPDALSALGDVLEVGDVIEALTHREARGAVNVWYNLDFDANVILSGLPIENVFELVVLTQTTWKGNVITYIPAKLLSVKRSKHRWDHFDASQFFFGSLDAASREWLGVGKEKSDLDLTRFGNRRYRVRNLSKILHYAKTDALRVRDLFSSFASESESVGVPCGRPYSTGYLGEQTMNVRFSKPGSSKPGFSFSQMQAEAWESYRGGRFEVIRRGIVGQAVTVDLNSAYPNVLRTLPDPGSLRWWRTTPELGDLSAAPFGIVDVTLSTDAARPLQPFAIRSGGKLTFPALRDVRLTVLKQDLEFGLSAGLVTDFQIHRAWLGYTAKTTVYPFRFLEELYQQRQEYKAAGKEKTQHVLKIIINSIYGKLCQLTETTALCDDDESPDYFPVELLPAKLRDWAIDAMVAIKRRTRCGSYFNPFLATHITGLTRLELMKTAISQGWESDVLMLATDSLMVRAEAFDRSGFGAKTSKDLGAWDLESRGDAFIVGSGIYEIAQDDGEVKARTRGFERGVGAFMVDLSKEGGLRSVARSLVPSDANEWGRVIPITTRRPMKIPQAIYQSFSLDNVGRFFEFPRGLSAGMDTKRSWERGSGVTWRELLESPEGSVPRSFDAAGPVP